MLGFVRGGLVPFVAGALFAVGLVLGGMTQPSKVVGFLDFFGDWDPSLAFVMGGAVAVYLPAYFLTRGRRVPWAVANLSLPTKREVDGRLVGGAALFGVGWGLAGYCPGPGIVSLSTGGLHAFSFVGSMVIGMMLMQQIDRLLLDRTLRAASRRGAVPDAPAASAR